MSASVGYSNPIGGSCKTNLNFMGLGSSLGGGIKGYIPSAIQDTNNYDNYAQIRFTLRQAYNTTYPSQLQKANLKRVITPFRALTNSGDILARRYYSCGGPCQSFQSRPGLFGLRGHFGAIQSHCDGTGVPAAACNTTFVYDSSDYVNYKRLNAVNKNYNAYDYGGDNSSTSQSASRAIRRF